MASLPFMKFYPADYLGDTGHLSTVEHGAYLLLLFHYWQKGESFKADSPETLNKRLANVARMNLDEWEKIKDTLAEFFDATETQWIHPRMEEDLEEARNKCEKAQKASEKAWTNRRRKADGKQTQSKRISECISERNADAYANAYADTMHSQSYTDTEEERREEDIYTRTCIDASIPDNNPEEASSLPQMVNAYNEALGDLLPQASILSSKMVIALKQNWEIDPARRDITFWHDVIFPKVRGSPFLTEAQHPGKKRSWRPDLSWILDPDNVANILNGKYDNCGAGKANLETAERKKDYGQSGDL